MYKRFLFISNGIQERSITNAYNSEGRYTALAEIAHALQEEGISYIYATDGLKIQLATKIQNNKYDYIKYNYNSISNKLYIISIIGMIITGTVFLAFSTYKIYTYIKSRTDKKILHIFTMC